MIDKKTIETYNLKVADYVKTVSSETPDQDLQAFIDALPSGAKVLDLGCGPGNSAAMMQAAGLAIEATDASEKMVETAHAKFGIKAKQATFDDLKAQAEYDGIWANFSLLHATRADMPRYLAAIHQALKPGGVFHIGMKIGTGEARDRLGRYYTYYEERGLKDLLRQAGFTVQNTRLGEGKGLAGDISPFVIILARI